MQWEYHQVILNINTTVVDMSLFLVGLDVEVKLKLRLKVEGANAKDP